MKLLPSFAVLALLSVIVGASFPHDGSQLARHNKLAMRRGTSSAGSGRCKARPSSAAPSSWSSSSSAYTSSTYSSSTYSSSTYSSSTSSYIPASTPAPSQAASSTNPPSWSPSSASSNSNPIGNIVGNIINAQSSGCGPSGATTDVTATTGPNGDINWLNCGLTSGSGWQPPYVTIQDIVSVDLNAALQQSGTPFTACTPYVWAFYQYGNQFSIPPIMLASFAMQESSCNPNTVGGAGEQGLMQLTSDKCGGAPGGNCQDVNYNVYTAAQYFSSNLAANNNNLLLTIGQYNGWNPGMTIASATAAKSWNCRAQNNLDYLQQFLNGWIQNIDAYTQGLGLYFNLNSCPS